MAKVSLNTALIQSQRNSNSPIASLNKAIQRTSQNLGSLQSVSRRSPDILRYLIQTGTKGEPIVNDGEKYTSNTQAHFFLPNQDQDRARILFVNVQEHFHDQLADHQHIYLSEIFLGHENLKSAKKLLTKILQSPDNNNYAFRNDVGEYLNFCVGKLIKTGAEVQKSTETLVNLFPDDYMQIIQLEKTFRLFSSISPSQGLQTASQNLILSTSALDSESKLMPLDGSKHRTREGYDLPERLYTSGGLKSWEWKKDVGGNLSTDAPIEQRFDGEYDISSGEFISPKKGEQENAFTQTVNQLLGYFNESGNALQDLYQEASTPVLGIFPSWFKADFSKKK